ncbi:MAG TPA: DUF192 domain-containing protein [Chloroflexia bacterium]|nr:DUF192 domain-containing protein [Chloroflexia bacterium]
MRLVKIVNRTRNVVVADKAEMAESVWTRFMGLMGRKGLEKGAGLVIYPNNSIHMFFMRFPIDVLHVSADGTILKILHSIKPWRVGPIVRKCKYTVELPAGTAQANGTTEGDRIELVNL